MLILSYMKMAWVLKNKIVIINLVKIGQMAQVEFEKVVFCLKPQSKINMESDSYKQYKK